MSNVGNSSSNICLGACRKLTSPGLSSSSCLAKNQKELEQQEAAATHLVDVTRGFVEAINTRTYRTHPSQQHLHPSFKTEQEYLPRTNNRDQHYDVMDTFLDLWPNHHKELASCSAHVNLKAGYADVYCHFFEVGVPDGVVRGSMAVMEWRWKRDKWWCVKYTGIRGLP